MSFLKKHWRFTVPAVVVLCTLLIGLVVMYSTGEPPEPKTVYAMPERTTDNPPPINTGGLLLSASATSDVHVGTAEAREPAIDADNLELCCPDELASVPSAASGQADSPPNVVPQAVIEDAIRYKEWRRAAENYNEKADAHLEKASLIANAFMSSTADFLALVPPDQLAMIRDQVARQPSADPNVREVMRTFWKSIPSQPNKTQEDIQFDFEALRSIFDAFTKNGASLSHDAEQVVSLGGAVE